MSSSDHIEDHASVMLDAARAIYECAGQPGSAATATAALARLEAALQLLSAGWYQVAADAPPGAGGRSREQEARRTAAMHDVAAAFARSARVCRDARPALQPLSGWRECPPTRTSSAGTSTVSRSPITTRFSAA